MTWYGGQKRTLELATWDCLWYRQGLDPAPIRWVLVRCPGQTTFRSIPILCSDPTISASQIVQWFVWRWNIEVTFQEIRTHLGFETQRHWSDRATERTVPLLFGLFSLVTLMAWTLHPQDLPRSETAWYHKDQATFSDALAAVRAHLWGLEQYQPSPDQPDLLLIPASVWLTIVRVAVHAT